MAQERGVNVLVLLRFVLLVVQGILMGRSVGWFQAGSTLFPVTFLSNL